MKLYKSIIGIFAAASVLTACRTPLPAYDSWKQDNANGSRKEYVKDGLTHDHDNRYRERRIEIDMVGAPAESSPNVLAAQLIVQAQNNMTSEERAELFKERRAHSEAAALVLALSQTCTFKNPADSTNIQMFTKSARKLGNIAYRHGNSIRVEKAGLSLSKDYEAAVTEAAQMLRRADKKTLVFTTAQ